MSHRIPSDTRAATEELALEAWRKDGNEAPLPKVYFFMRRNNRPRLGRRKGNDVAINDDLGILTSPTVFDGRDMNADPSKLGYNENVGKPYGMLKPGVWWFYPGPHKGHNPSFRQADDADVARKLGIPHEGKFHVTRMWGWDDPRNYSEWGHQQVNIHWQRSVVGTSSWLCLTVPLAYSDEWLGLAQSEMRKYKQKIIPVILVEGPIN